MDRMNAQLSPLRLVAGSLAMAIVVAAPLAASAQSATASVEYREFDDVYVADGVVEAVRQSTIAAQIAGRIIELRVDVGDAVAKGQVIARIDEREAAQLVASNEAQIARAQADLSNAKANLERTRKLVEQKFVSQAALDKAQAEYDVAAAAHAAAKAGTGAAATVQSYTVITAPFAGVVAERQAQIGEMAQPGKALFTLFDPKDLRVAANVRQDVVAKLRAQAKTTGAYAELPALAKTVPVKAVTLLPAADTRTHTTLVRLDLPDGDVKGAYPGMFARVQLSSGKTKKLAIPSQAVARRSEVAGVYVVGPKGDMRFRQVRLGEPLPEGRIEVLAGVSAGESIALDPVAALTAIKQAAAK
jgi:RND family efflux transporter MFP subunit